MIRFAVDDNLRFLAARLHLLVLVCHVVPRNTVRDSYSIPVVHRDDEISKSRFESAFLFSYVRTSLQRLYGI